MQPQKPQRKTARSAQKLLKMFVLNNTTTASHFARSASRRLSKRGFNNKRNWMEQDKHREEK